MLTHGTGAVVGALRRAVAFPVPCRRRPFHSGRRLGNPTTSPTWGRVDPGPTGRADPVVGCLHGHPDRGQWCHVMSTTPAKRTKPVEPLSVPESAADLDAGSATQTRCDPPDRARSAKHREDSALDSRGGVAASPVPTNADPEPSARADHSKNGAIPTRTDHRSQHPRPSAAPRHRRHHRRRFLPPEGRQT